MCLAVPGRVESIQNIADLAGEASPLGLEGRVDFGGVTRQVNLSCVPEIRVGEFVMVHAGIAIARVDPAEAERAIRQWREIAELESGGDS
ncbi:MAG: HypC/HybG/HupF family hydrogenase formation chaperone [Leptospiraceae bacterium]|nr:HypC/HybG/HupF family hydrogenase formation chaperone [Leptospiraceae bacterium]